MIRMADVLRFAGQSHIDVSIAVQEVILTILLQRIFTSPVGDRLAFKGGTALRKLVFGAAGRFSEDLDFAVIADDHELAQLELEEVLVKQAGDEVSVSLVRSEIAGPGTMQSSFRFESPIGAGTFEVDATSSERPVLLSARRQHLAAQPYFAALGFNLSDVLAVRSCEMATGKLCAIHRRSENRNPKDSWDLWKWLAVASPQEAEILRILWPSRWWLDGVSWRGAGWFDRLTDRGFNWDRLRPLVPAGRLNPEQIVSELKARVRLEMCGGQVQDGDGWQFPGADRRFPRFTRRCEPRRITQVTSRLTARGRSASHRVAP